MSNPWGLTPREAEVMNALVRLGTRKAVGRELGIAEKTIDVHARNVRDKMGERFQRAALLKWHEWAARGRVDDNPVLQVEPCEGYTRRVYADGRKTVEVAETVIRAWSWARFEAACRAWLRGQAQRAESAELRAKVTELLAAGWKPTAIESHLGITEARVRQIRKELEDGHQT